MNLKALGKAKNMKDLQIEIILILVNKKAREILIIIAPKDLHITIILIEDVILEKENQDLEAGLLIGTTEVIDD